MSIQPRQRTGLYSDLKKGSSGWAAQRNYNSDRIDQLLSAAILGEVADSTALPATPNLGDTYYVQDSARLYTWYDYDGFNSWFSDFTPIGLPIYNITTDTFYYFNGGSLVVWPGGGGGTGDVVGPASSIDSNLAAYDGLTGKLIKDSGITMADVITAIAATAGFTPGNYDLSSSSGNFTTSSTSPTAVTNLSCTLTTTGKPVVLAIIGDGSINRSYFSLQSASDCAMDIYFIRSGTNIDRRWFALDIGTEAVDLGASSETPWTVDIPPAGTYTWTVEVEMSGAGETGGVRWKKLFAYELP